MSLNRRLANLGNVIDSATTGHFLSKGDSDGQFSTVAYTSISGRPASVLDSALTSQLVDSSYIQLRQTSSAAGIDSALITTLIDSSYVAARSSSSGDASGFVKFQYTATNNQTTFQDSASSGVVLAYSKDHVLVHYNGVVLPASDYTATNGNSVVLGTGADSGAIISIASWSHGTDFGGNDIAWYGGRAVVGGRDYPSKNTIDYFNIGSSGNASDFGDLQRARFGGVAFSNITYGIFAGGTETSVGLLDEIDRVTIATTANSTDFGDLTTTNYNQGAFSNGTRGGAMCGYDGSTRVDKIDYITIATPGNAADFGDMGTDVNEGSGVNDNTYAVHTGGYGQSASSKINEMRYITMATLGNGTDFGDLDYTLQSHGSAGDATRGVTAGGHSGASNYTSAMDYITISTPGNSTDFGSLSVGRTECDGAGDGTYACFAGGYTGSGSNVIDRITVQTPGNAADHGDLTQAGSYTATCSGNAA